MAWRRSRAARRVLLTGWKGSMAFDLTKMIRVHPVTSSIQ